MYKELFKLAGYSKEEIKKERPRIEKMLERIGVTTEEDIKHSEEWTKINYEVELEGVRKLIKFFMMNFIDAVLAREENDLVIYFNQPAWPLISLPVVKAAQAAGKKIFIGNGQDYAWQIMGPVFDKANDLLEKAELMGQPAGKAHCSHYQLNLAVLEQGIIPKPDISWVSGMICDQAQMADHLAINLAGGGITVVSLDGLNDWGFDSYLGELEEHGIKYAAERIKRSYAKIEEVAGIKIMPEHIKEAGQILGMTFAATNNLVEMNAKGDPQPLRSSTMMWAQQLMFMTPRYQYESDIKDLYNTLLRDCNNRIKSGKGVVPKGAPRVYAQIPTSLTDFRAMNMIEDLGLHVCSVFVGKLFPENMAPSGKFKDPYELMAESYYKVPFCAGVNSNVQYVKKICEYFKLDGVILSYLYSCRPLAQAVVIAKNMVKELGIPVLLAEADTFDARNYSAQQLKTRAESFAEMLKMNKKALAA